VGRKGKEGPGSEANLSGEAVTKSKLKKNLQAAGRTRQKIKRKVMEENRR